MNAKAPNANPEPNFGPVKARPLSRIQLIVAERLASNAATIPHVTHNDEIDITDVEEARKALKGDVKVTTLIYLIKALVEALKAYPDFNASLSEDGKTLVLKEYFNIGIAVDTPRGLVVPVLRNCDQKSLTDIAAELTELSEQARTKGLPYEIMTGGCITVTSLGGIGGTSFTPIINAPEVAILGVTRAQVKPVWNGAIFEPRKILPLSLSYDHRVINGADAARFVCKIAEALRDFAGVRGC